jgi:hypothetical protein
LSSYTIRFHVLGFRNNNFLQSKFVSLASKYQPRGLGPVFIPPVTGWPSYNPRHRVPFSSSSMTRRAKQIVKKIGTSICGYIRNSRMYFSEEYHLWDVKPCNLVKVYRHLRGTYLLLLSLCSLYFKRKDGGNTVIRNILKFLRDYMASRPRRW